MEPLSTVRSPSRSRPSPASRRKILFLSEAVTLCHVARPLALARALDPNRYEIHFACAKRFHSLLRGLPSFNHSLDSIECEQFLKTLAAGNPVFTEAILRRYVQEDLQLITEIRPDLIVGDFRLSLSVSARLVGIPYYTISNAYWSPYARQTYTIPELPVTRFLDPRLADIAFSLIRPLAFALHTRPLNAVRKEHGLPSLGIDLRRIYTDADVVLYADCPELVPTADLPRNHRYLGPIRWSMPGPLPSWWDALPADRKTVFVTLGSSGQVRILPAVIDALKDLPVNVLLATSGRFVGGDLPKNVFAADYLPGVEASERADLVVCHGGSAPAYAALGAGTPVLGIPSNMDQHLSIEYIRRAGAGEALRAELATAASIRRAVLGLLSATRYRDAAGRLARAFARRDAGKNFAAIIQEALYDRHVL